MYFEQQRPVVESEAEIEAGDEEGGELRVIFAAINPGFWSR